VPTIAGIWYRVQRALFYVEEMLPEAPAKHREIVQVLEVVRVEELVPPRHLHGLGRTPEDRRTLARAFLVRACLNLSTTRALLDRLRVDRVLR
jgi:hypothetical protein